MTDRPFPIAFNTLTVDTRPRRWLVLPTGFEAASTPDAVSPVFAVTPQALLEAFVAAGLGEPRTQIVREEGMQVELVQRSAVFGFPDYITVEAMAHGEGSALAVYSRAVIGYSDVGVNRKRIGRWIAATQAALA